MQETKPDLETSGGNKYSFGIFGEKQNPLTQNYQFLYNPAYNMTPFQKPQPQQQLQQQQLEQPISTIQKQSLIDTTQQNPNFSLEQSEKQPMNNIQTAQFPKYDPQQSTQQQQTQSQKQSLQKPPISSVPQSQLKDPNQPQSQQQNNLQSSIKPINFTKQSQFINSQSYEIPSQLQHHQPQESKIQNISFISDQINQDSIIQHPQIQQQQQQPRQPTAHFVALSDKKQPIYIQEEENNFTENSPTKPQPNNININMPPQYPIQQLQQDKNNYNLTHRSSHPTLPTYTRNIPPQPLQQQQIQQFQHIPTQQFQQQPQQQYKRSYSVDNKPLKIHENIPAGAKIIPQSELPDYIRTQKQQEFFNSTQQAIQNKLLSQQQQNQQQFQQQLEHPIIQPQFLQQQQPPMHQQQNIQLNQPHIQQHPQQQQFQPLIQQQQQQLQLQQQAINPQFYQRQQSLQQYQPLDDQLHINRRIPYTQVQARKTLKDQQDNPLREIRSNYLYKKDAVYNDDLQNEIEREKALLRQEIEDQRQFYLDQQKRQAQQRETDPSHPHPNFKYYHQNNYPDFPYNRSTFETHLKHQLKKYQKQDLPNSPKINEINIQQKLQRDQQRFQPLTQNETNQTLYMEKKPLLFNPNIHQPDFSLSNTNLSDINSYKPPIQQQIQPQQQPFTHPDYNAKPFLDQLEQQNDQQSYYHKNEHALKSYASIQDQEKRQEFINSLKQKPHEKKPSFYGDVIPRQKYSHKSIENNTNTQQQQNPKDNRFYDNIRNENNYYSYNDALYDTVKQPSLYEQYAQNPQNQTLKI